MFLHSQWQETAPLVDESSHPIIEVEIKQDELPFHWL